MNIKNVALIIVLIGGFNSLFCTQETQPNSVGLPVDQTYAVMTRIVDDFRQEAQAGDLSGAINTLDEKLEAAVMHAGQIRLTDIESLIALKKFLDECRQEAQQGKADVVIQKLDDRLEALLLQYLQLEEKKVQKISSINIAAGISAACLACGASWLLYSIFLR